MMLDLQTAVIKPLKLNGFEFIESYLNGELGFWGFNKERNIEVTIKVNENPDEESISNFEEHIKDEINK